MSSARGDAGDEVELELDGPDAFDDPDALERLRANAFESVGLPYAEGILYGIGVAEGLVDALRVAHRFAGPLGGAPRSRGSGPAAPVLRERPHPGPRASPAPYTARWRPPCTASATARRTARSAT